MTASLEHKRRVLAHLEGQQAQPAGKLPWRVVSLEGVPRAIVKDFNGAPMCTTHPVIANLIVSAVNERNKLFGDNVNYRDVLSSLFEQVYAMAPSDGRTRALDLIERTLHPDKDDLGNHAAGSSA